MIERFFFLNFFFKFIFYLKFSIEKDNSEDENDENLNSSFWYLILLFGVSVLFSGFGLCIGIYFGATCVDRIKKAFDNFFNYLRHF